METLAFDSSGNLYIGTQSSLYGYNLTLNQATLIGSYGGAFQLGSTGQNMRFAGTTLYVSNTDPDLNDTDLYSLDISTGLATWFGEVVGHPGLALGNYGSALYGSSVPAVQGQGSGPLTLLYFGTTVTRQMGPDPDNPEAQEYLVDHVDALTPDEDGNGGFPLNYNFSGVPVPEPSTWMIFLSGAGSLALLRRRVAK
jgi:hypothetical protein